MSGYQYQGEALLFSNASLYPSPEPSEAYTMQQSSAYGLGLVDYNSAYAPHPVATTTAPPSPPSSASMLWSQSCSSGHLQTVHPRGSQPLPPSAYTHLSPYHAPSPSVSMDPAFSLTPNGAPELTPSPEASCNVSHRSSFSSCAPSEAFLSAHDDPSVQARIKSERSTEWLVGQVGGLNVRGSMLPQQPSPMNMGGVSLTNPFGAPSYDDAMCGTEMCSGSGDDTPGMYDGRSDSFSSLPSAANRGLRTRKRRRLTTAAEANHTCEVCGKLFGRSYNYKAHLETHDPGRVYAHPCLEENCDKKFVRKTDLTRHHHSVHQKRRDFGCELCGHRFARKDTLRRHAEDGCTRRFEIASKIIQTSDHLQGDGAQTIAIDVSAGGRVLVRTRRSSAELSGVSHASTAAGSAGPGSASHGRSSMSGMSHTNTW